MTRLLGLCATVAFLPTLLASDPRVPLPQGLDVIGLAEAKTDKCPCTDRSKVKAVCVWHGKDSNPFWLGLKQAAEQAAADMGIDLSVRLFPDFSEDDMAKAVEEEAAKSPSFMVVSVPGPKVAAKVKKLTMPVFTVNAGFDEDVGSINYIGMNESSAGFLAGKRLLTELPDIKQAVFVNSQKGNVAMDARSAGMKQAMAAANVDFKELIVDAGDDAALKGKLVGDDPVGILIGDSLAVSPVLKELEDAKGKVAAIAMDTNDDIFKAIKSGKLVAAVDQQPWLQGYLPVVLGTLRITTNMSVARSFVPTGPVLVTEPPPPAQADCIQKGKCVERKSLVVAGVVHAIEKEEFWDVVNAGAEAAARDLGVKLAFDRPPSVKEAVGYIKEHLQKRVATSDAIIASPALKPLEPAVTAVAKKVPTFCINAGGPEANASGCLNFIGQNEDTAGKRTGEHMLSLTKCKRPACVLKNATHRMFFRRCRGFNDAMSAAGVKPKKQYVEVGKSSLIHKKLKEAYGEEKPDCLFLTTGMLLPEWTKAGPSDATVASMMTNIDSVKSLQKGEAAFLVDQQPFLQGYLPVLLATIKLQTGLQIPQMWLESGPAAVTAKTMDTNHYHCLFQGFPTCKTEPLLEAYATPTRPAKAPRVGSGAAAASAAASLCALAISAAALLSFRRSRPRPDSVDGPTSLEEPLD